MSDLADVTALRRRLNGPQRPARLDSDHYPDERDRAPRDPLRAAQLHGQQQRRARSAAFFSAFSLPEQETSEQTTARLVRRLSR